MSILLLTAIPLNDDEGDAEMRDMILPVACLLGMIGWVIAYFVFFRKIARASVLLSALLAAIAFSITVWLLFIPMADWDFALRHSKRYHGFRLFDYLALSVYMVPWMSLWFLDHHKKPNPPKR